MDNENSLQAPREGRNSMISDFTKSMIRRQGTVPENLSEEIIMRLIDVNMEPLRKIIKGLEYDLKDVFVKLDMKAGPSEMSAIDRRFDLYWTMYNHNKHTELIKNQHPTFDDFDNLKSEIEWLRTDANSKASHKDLAK